MAKVQILTPTPFPQSDQLTIEVSGHRLDISWESSPARCDVQILHKSNIHFGYVNSAPKICTIEIVTGLLEEMKSIPASEAPDWLKEALDNAIEGLSRTDPNVIFPSPTPILQSGRITKDFKVRSNAILDWKTQGYECSSRVGFDTWRYGKVFDDFKYHTWDIYWRFQGEAWLIATSDTPCSEETLLKSLKQFHGSEIDSLADSVREGVAQLPEKLRNSYPEFPQTGTRKASVKNQGTVVLTWFSAPDKCTVQIQLSGNVTDIRGYEIYGSKPCTVISVNSLLEDRGLAFVQTGGRLLDYDLPAWEPVTISQMQDQLAQDYGTKGTIEVMTEDGINIVLDWELDFGTTVEPCKANMKIQGEKLQMLVNFIPKVCMPEDVAVSVENWQTEFLNGKGVFKYLESVVNLYITELER